MGVPQYGWCITENPTKMDDNCTTISGNLHIVEMSRSQALPCLLDLLDLRRNLTSVVQLSICIPVLHRTHQRDLALNRACKSFSNPFPHFNTHFLDFHSDMRNSFF